ncbi:MAG: dephospho-CoA kinase [Candidatus Margulisbacteria bacterium]|nr:dephospho-CoA kinase [Candidatus Margulisiibacteriota bacterium]
MPKAIVGITGRTGSGKSMACEWILESIPNVEHIDCDHVGHKVLEMPDVKPKLLAAFGPTIQGDGAINRKALGHIVFNNKRKLEQLNDIVHPKICDEVRSTINSTKKNVVIIEGALIHQVGLEHMCTHTICIDSPTATILARRPNNENILSKQPKANDYINMCHHTIKNNTSIALFKEKITQLFLRIGISS